VPDEEPGSVIKAGMGEIEVFADANGAGVGVVATEDRIAICFRGGRDCEGGSCHEGKGCGGGGRAEHEASAVKHGLASIGQEISGSWLGAEFMGGQESTLGETNDVATISS